MTVWFIMPQNDTKDGEKWRRNDVNNTWFSKWLNDANDSKWRKTHCYRGKWRKVLTNNANYLRSHNLTQKHGQNKMTQLIHNASKWCSWPKMIKITPNDANDSEWPEICKWRRMLPTHLRFEGMRSKQVHIDETIARNSWQNREGTHSTIDLHTLASILQACVLWRESVLSHPLQLELLDNMY